MKRLIIICEGETEQQFCKDVLYNHFFSRDIVIETPLIKKSMGGLVSWESIKKQILLHLQGEAIVTMLIDYYGIEDKHFFPKWTESKAVVSRIDRMTFLENAMKEDIDDRVRFRFVPYIQLHEFEGLLFNNIETFKNIIPENEFTNIRELETTINSNINPELINDGVTTAPSKRLESLILGYNKIVYGAVLAEEIGLERIRAKAVRFNEWIAKLESI